MVVRRTGRLAPDARLTSRLSVISAPPLGGLGSLGRAALALALVAASLSAAPEAHAELDLRWDAPPSCPQRSEVLERIRAIAGSTLDETEGLSAEARITREHGRVRLDLLVRDGREARRRVIASDSCSALAGAAAITLALLLRADAGSGEPRADDAEPASTNEGQGERSGEQAELRVAPSREPARAESRATRGWALVVRAPVVAADLGPMPRPALGFGFGIGLRRTPWSIVLTGNLSREQTLGALDPGATFGAELQRATGQLTTCRGWRFSQFELAPCVGLALQHVTARGFGEGVSPQAQRAVGLAPGVGAVAHWYMLEAWALFAGVSGHLELSRPRLVIQDLGEVRQLGPATLGAAVGFEWIL